MRRLIARCRDEDGQTMAEYAVTTSIITAAIVASIALLSDTVRGVIQNTIDVL